MKKSIAAATIGLLLAAGQAAAAQSGDAVARIGDRIGAPAGASSELAGASPGGLLWAAAAIAFIAYGVSEDDDSESD